MMNPEVKEGDKIVLVYMKDEQGMTPGTKGVVTRVTRDPFEEDDLLISVDWENGRPLSIVSAEDLWMLDSDEKEPIQEQKLPNNANPCDSIGEGSEFCKKLSNILKSGRGGKGAKLFKRKSYETFTKLRDEGFGKGMEVQTLEPGNPFFDARIDELKKFFGLLTKYNACSKMRNDIKNDIINVKKKQLKMITDDEEYSILNRLDTHYSGQAYILTLLAKDLDFYMIDTYDNDQIIEEVELFILNKPHRIKDKINTLMDDEKGNVVDTLSYSKIKGGRVELGAVKAFEKLGYTVYNFATDFGFVDHFGVDMLVEKDGEIHPVQVSSQRKFNPEIAKYNDMDCECWMVYQDRNSGKFRKETIMEQSKEDVTKKLIDNNIEPSIIDDLLGSLTDEDITDLVMRNLDRKLFKGGDKEKNVRDYFEKYIKSLADRTEQDPNDDFDVEDEFLYGGEEPEKSKIGRKQFKSELLPLQVELLKLQEDVKKTGKAIAVVFEGRDSAGKGSTIKRMVEYLDPKYYNIIALGIPTKEERQDWFGRYEKHIEPGKINFFDRSWYNRGIVEPVMGYSSEEEYIDFMENVNDFEQSLIDRGIELVKFWLSITPETQKKRFQMRKASPLKYWKFSPNDEKSIDKWDKYTEYKNKVLKQTKEAKPWTVVDTNDKRAGILNAFRHLLKVVDYEGKEEENVGSVYPEVVTTIKEKEMTEAGNHHWTDWQRVSDVLGRENKILYDFFEKLRLSSVMNMLESTHFIYSGSDYLRRYIQFNQYENYDEDKYEELYDAADEAKHAMIRLSIESLERKGKETSLENINSEVKLLARQALQAFIMMK